LGLPNLGISDVLTMMSGLDPEASYEALSGALAEPGSTIAALVGIAFASVGYAFFILILAGPPAFFTRQWSEPNIHQEMQDLNNPDLGA
jgi:hypothetical protein